MEIAKFQWVKKPKTPEPIDKKIGVDDYVDDDSPHVKTRTRNAPLAA